MKVQITSTYEMGDFNAGPSETTINFVLDGKMIQFEAVSFDAAFNTIKHLEEKFYNAFKCGDALFYALHLMDGIMKKGD